MIRHGVKEDTVETEEDTNFVREIQAVENMPDCIEKHERMVLHNPDDYNSWNYLKAKFLDTEDKAAIKKQLELTQKALEENPKSYATWYHRHLFFQKLKESWFREHKLCELLLHFDPRNFHCWNYCLKNGFEIKTDLHNPTSLHFGEFRRDMLFVDTSDECLWRAFEKSMRREGMIREYKDRIEMIFNIPVQGNITVMHNRLGRDNISQSHDAVYPTKRIVMNKSIQLEGRMIKVNDALYRISKGFLPGTVEEIIQLDPNCIFALKYKLEYTEDEEERRRIVEKLQEIDPLRRKYYQSLERYRIYEIYRDCKY